MLFLCKICGLYIKIVVNVQKYCFCAKILFSMHPPPLIASIEEQAQNGGDCKHLAGFLNFFYFGLDHPRVNL